MEDEKEFYLVEIIFCSKSYFLVWETNDEGDTFLIKEGRIFVNSSKNFYEVIFNSDEVKSYDFDNISKALHNNFKDFGSNEILDFWNLTQDATDTISYDFIGSEHKYGELYNKLFQNTNAGKIVKEYIAKTPIKNETEIQMEKSLYKNKKELQYTKKDRENLCLIISQAIGFWSEIIGGITKEDAIKKLKSKYNYCAGKHYIPLIDIETKADNFFIMRGTINIYEKYIKDFIIKKYGQVFYLSINKQSYYWWRENYFEMSDKVEFDDSRMCESVMFPKDFSFLIYVSHDQTITFAGQIVDNIKKILSPVAHKYNKRILC